MLERLKRLVYDLLARPGVRRVYESSTSTVLGVVSHNRVASHTYHTVAPLSFSREQQASVAGRHAYYETKHTPGPTSVQLRRNTHRLEKGLLMKPPRPVFALDYIGETLDSYEAVLAKHADDERSHDVGELAWAADVLTAYFDRVGDHPEAAEHAARFATLASPASLRSGGAMVPYHRDGGPPPVSYDDLLALSMQRRSVRWFDDRPVPRELIDQALLVGRQGPTACNRMPYEFRIFDDPELVRTVSSIPFGTGGYAENIPTIAVVVGRLDSYFSPRDRHAIYIDSSLAVMGTLLALETLGLASCVINWPDFEPLEMKMQKTLGLEIHERPIMLVAIGYPDDSGMVAASEKKDLDTFRFYNRVDGDD